MREIKFRAWVATDWGENGRPCKYKMVEWSNDFFSDTSIVTGYSDEFPTEPDCYLMQYTGLKDVNGKEIYEGDILEYFSGLVAKGSNPIIRQVVKWEQYRYSIDNYKNSSVVGNVHEHPELLEGSQC